MKIGLLAASAKSYNVVRLTEEIKKRGHTVKFINYLECYANISQSSPKVFYRGKPITDLDAIIPQIMVPSTDYGVAIIRQFEMMGVFSTVGSLALTRARNKIYQMQLFSRTGLDIPKSAFAHSAPETDAAALVKMVGGAPLIIKVARGSMGNGVMLAETDKAARAAIEAFLSQSVSVLVQEYIEESEGKDIRAFIVGGKVVAAMQREAAEGEFRSNIYHGGSSKPVKLTKNEKQLAQIASKTTHLPIAGVDIIQSTRGPLIQEINAYPNMQGIEKTTGINIAESVVKYVEECLPRKRSGDKVGA
jgi:ribosomal protein S6--L-glutamate ligase